MAFVLAIVATATVAAQQPEPAKPTPTTTQDPGTENPTKSSSIRGFALAKEQRADLVAFLQSLTDEALLRDPRLGNPWVRQPDR